MSHPNRRLRSLLLPGAIAVLLASTVLAQQPVRVNDSTLRHAGKKGDVWLTYGLDWAETRYSPLKNINADNVARLGLAWSYDIGPGGGGQEATPLVWNKTLYSITNWSITFAVDARTGKEVWRWDPQVNQAATRPKVCCGVVNRGLAIYEGKIFVPVIDGRLVALDALNGKVLWQAQVSTVEENYTLTMAPRIAKGKVIIGVAGAEYPSRGYFDAYDATTGKRVWRCYTVPGDPAKPYENEAMRKAAATWSGDFWKNGAGGSVWDGMAYDPEADLFYVGTGNGGPWPEELRYSKGKDNLYICSILAVKPDTGEIKWYFQVVPGDSWDYDSVQQLTLVDLTINGKKRKVIMQANKDGFFYVLDRITGEFISAEPFVTVTWAKGVDKKTGRPIENPEARYGADLIPLAPGPGGGHNWAPMAFNPTTGLVYIPATLNSAWLYSVAQNFVYKPGRMNLGLGGPAGLGGGRTPAPTAAPPGHTGNETPPPLPAGAKPSPPSIGPLSDQTQQQGALVAWDPVAQKERWHTLGGGNFWGGCLTTASNLVIQVIPDGRLVVLSADKGEKLFEIQTGFKSGMGPPITYEIDSKQYITLSGGQGSSAPPAAGQTSARPAPPSSNAPKMLTFMLDGKAPLPGQ